MSAPTISAPTPPIDTRAVAQKPWYVQMLKTRAAAILGLDIILFIVFTFLSTDKVFASVESVQALLIAGTEALLLAVGLTMLLGAGIFDLSLGANLVLSSVVGAKVMTSISPVSEDFTTWSNVGQGVVAGIIACIITGMLFGIVNGLLIAYLRINAVIATLAALGIGTGIAFVLSGGCDISGLPPRIQENFGLASWGPIPYPALVALVVTLIFYLIVKYTRFGMRTLAIGSSQVAAVRAGIQVPRHLMRLTITAGALAGLAGFIDLTRFASTAISGHGNDALNAVTAAVIGGTLLEGGKISMLGTLWGTGLAVILQGGLIIIGVSSYYQLIAVGVVLIIAVALDRVTSSRRVRG